MSESLEHTYLACIRLFVTLPLLHLSAMYPNHLKSRMFSDIHEKSCLVSAIS
jgi:hypothetical protein